MLKKAVTLTQVTGKYIYLCLILFTLTYMYSIA